MYSIVTLYIRQYIACPFMWMKINQQAERKFLWRKMCINSRLIGPRSCFFWSSTVANGSMIFLFQITTCLISLTSQPVGQKFSLCLSPSSVTSRKTEWYKTACSTLNMPAGIDSLSPELIKIIYEQLGCDDVFNLRLSTRYLRNSSLDFFIHRFFRRRVHLLSLASLLALLDISHHPLFGPLDRYCGDFARSFKTRKTWRWALLLTILGLVTRFPKRPRKKTLSNVHWWA